MAPKYVLSHRAYLSMLLHAAKHPHQAVNGVMLAAPASGDEVLIERTIPLLHHWTGLSPMMEIGLDLAATYAKEAGLRIYGYYQAIPSIQTQGPGPVGEKILSKLRETTPEAFGLLIALDGLSSKAPIDTPGLSAIPPVQLSLRSRQSPTRTMELIGSGLQASYADFDDHLENVHLDWLENPTCTDKDWSA